MNKPLRQPTLSTTMKSLIATIREERGAGGEVSEAVLQAMIRTTPRVLRRELVESIERLEVMLEVSGFPHVTWLDALRRYRAVAAPAGIPAATGLLPQVVLESAREVDRAFAKAYAFEPEDYLSDPVGVLAQSRRQSKAGAATGAKVSARASADRELRRPLIEETILRLCKFKKVGPEALKLSAVRKQFASHLPKDFPVNLPGDTTLNSEIKAVLAAMKKQINQPVD